MNEKQSNEKIAKKVIPIFEEHSKKFVALKIELLHSNIRTYLQEGQNIVLCKRCLHTGTGEDFSTFNGLDFEGICPNCWADEKELIDLVD